MSRFVSFLLAASLSGAGFLIPAVAYAAPGVGIVMTGVVHTDCRASVSQTVIAANGRTIDLGLLSRQCNDGEGYRVILHTPKNLHGATLVLQDRRVPLAESGQTIIIDSNDMERSSSQPALIMLASAATGEFPIRLETVPKGPIY